VQGYDVAQICLNGHVTNSSIRDFPHHNQEYCNICGTKTVTACQGCQKKIRGRLRGVLTIEPMSAPAFCQHCGKPFPWTEARIEAARDLADQLGLDVPDRTLLEKSIDELLRDSPRAPAEAVRFRTILCRAKPWGLEAFKQVLGMILSEGVKKLIWPA